ncbi:MAG: Fe-S cluster assembly protein SufD [Myxococcota bacterium]
MTETGPRLLTSLPEAFDEGPAWFRTLRERAAGSLRDHGLPTKKTEAWRFTPVRSIVDGSFDREDDGLPRVTSPLPDGVTVRSLRDVLAEEPSLLEDRLGRTPVDHFGALNTSLFTDGLWIHVAASVAAGSVIELDHGFAGSAPSSPTVRYPRVLVTLEPGSQATLIETYGGDRPGSLTNSVMEVDLGSNALLHHVRIHEQNGLQVGYVDVRQDRDSRYHSVVATLGGALLRFDVRVHLEAPGAQCQLDGAYFVDGSDHVDHHTLVEHKAPHCRSAQTYRGIASGRGTAVFDGIVVVHRDAQKTEAHQENRNLLLSETATVHTKPHLEIDADDVVCSHGATVGSLDHDQLFYLRARGIPEDMARAILTYAFIEAVVDRVSDPATRERLREAVLARIPEGEAIRGVT